MARVRSLVGFLVVGLITFVAAAPVHAQAQIDWRQFHGSPTHRGFNPAEQQVGKGNVTQLGISWIGNGATFGPDLVFKSSPAIVDGYVYFGTDGGQLLAFRDTCPSSECDPAWKLDLTEAIYNTPAVVNGVLYVGTASTLGKLYAFDVAACAQGTCEPLWTGDVAVGDSSPTVAGGVVYVGDQFDGVYAFDAAGCGQATCDPLWVGETNDFVVNSPAVANGVLYVGSNDHNLYAFDAAGCGQPRCEPLWTGPVNAPILSSSPAVSHGVVYVASFAASPNSRLYAFPAAGCGESTCDPVWKSTGAHYLNSSPAVAYGLVYIGAGDGTMLVYRAAGCGQPTCPPVWIDQPTSIGGGIESAPMVANGVVYVGENNSRVYAFSARGCGRPFCSELWNFITQDPLVNSSPTMVNGTLWLTGTNFSSVPELYVFELPTG
jgi:outer membrane protein assembly factor BamB